MDQTKLSSASRRMRSPLEENRRVALNRTGRSGFADHTTCGGAMFMLVIIEALLV